MLETSDLLCMFRQAAEELLKQKRYQELQDASVEMLKSTPNSFLGYFFEAEALTGLGKREQALPFFKQAASLIETETNAEFKATYVARLLQVKIRMEATEHTPQPGSGPTLTYMEYLSRGEKFLALDQAEEALDEFEHAIEVDKTQVSAHLKRFAVLIRLDRAEQMLAAAKELLLVTPSHWIGHFYSGLALGSLARDEEAVEAYSKAIEIAPREAPAYVNRGATYGSLGHMEKSLADSEKALLLKPKQSSAMVNKALALRTTGQPKEAIKVCNEIVKFEPKCALAYCNRALANFILNRTEEALEDADLSIKYSTQPMYVAKCKCIKAKFLALGGGGGGGNGGYRRDGKDEIEEARQLCDSAVRLAPMNSHPWRYAWSTSALVSGMMGDFDSANSNVQLVLDHAKGFIYGINIKAQILLMQNRLDEALVTVNSALALNPKEPESYAIRHQIRTKLGDAKANEDLTKARKLGFLRDE